MLLKLKDILPNPFRDLKTNPLIEEKIVGLMDSIHLTGFWENVVVRKNSEGKYELAYGHHRLEAAIRSCIVEADFIVKKFDDAKMIQVMDNENRETYGSTPQSLIESVRAVVQALAKEAIPLFKLSKDTPVKHIRYAPSYAAGTEPSPSSGERHPYTALCIAQFLGRVRKQGKEAGVGISAALDFLYLKEKGRFSDSLGKFSDSLLKKKDETGALVPITMNELVKRTNEIKRDVERVEVRTVKSKEDMAAFDTKQRELAKVRKEAEEKAEAERKRLVAEKVAAMKAENEERAKKIQERLDAKDAAAAEADKYFVEKTIQLEVKIAEAKEAAALAKKEDDYLPIKREVERILHKLEGSTSTGKEALMEEVKSLVRLPLNNTDRERLRQAALTMGAFYTDWVAMQFIPPFAASKKLNEYRSREAANRRNGD
jgi:hypothetical protein